MLNFYAKVENFGIEIPKRKDDDPYVCAERDKGFQDCYINAIEEIARSIIVKQGGLAM